MDAKKTSDKTQWVLGKEIMIDLEEKIEIYSDNFFVVNHENGSQSGFHRNAIVFIEWQRGDMVTTGKNESLSFVTNTNSRYVTSVPTSDKEESTKMLRHLFCNFLAKGAVILPDHQITVISRMLYLITEHQEAFIDLSKVKRIRVSPAQNGYLCYFAFEGNIPSLTILDGVSSASVQEIYHAISQIG